MRFHNLDLVSYWKCNFILIGNSFFSTVIVPGISSISYKIDNYELYALYLRDDSAKKDEMSGKDKTTLNFCTWTLPKNRKGGCLAAHECNVFSNFWFSQIPLMTYVVLMFVVHFKHGRFLLQTTQPMNKLYLHKIIFYFCEI